MKITDFNVAVAEIDSHLSRWVEEHGRLDIAEGYIHKFSHHIPFGGVVADIGACLGDHTLTYSKLVGVPGTVHAFEPNPEAFQCLAYNMKDRHNVVLYPNGLGSCTMQATVKRSPNLGASQLVPFDLGKIVVERLDDLAGDWRRLDFMKIDAEGAEPDIIAGGEETIKRLKPVMLVEINRPILEERGRSAEGLIGMIRGLGYSIRPAEVEWSLDMPMVDVLCEPI